MACFEANPNIPTCGSTSIPPVSTPTLIPSATIAPIASPPSVGTTLSSLSPSITNVSQWTPPSSLGQSTPNKTPVGEPPVASKSTPISPSPPGTSSISGTGAAANATTSNQAPSKQISSGNSLGSGAVAGIAIAMLIVGAVISGLVFFFLLRRQKKKQLSSYYNQHASYTQHSAPYEKTPTVAASALPRSVEELLPQPAEDDALTGQISKIRDNIKNHVRTYYEFGPVDANIVETHLHDLAQATGMNHVTLHNALLNPSTRNDSLRLFVSWIILSRCTGDRQPTLLPGEVAGFSFPKAGQDQRSDGLYSKWKVLTAALIQHGREGEVQSSAPRSQNFDQTIADLDSVLVPFVRVGVDGGQRRRNLDMILSRSADFAFLLFMQPGSFRFDFGGHQGGLVVFPSLIQTAGDQGQVLNPPRLLSEQEVVASTGL